MSQTLFTNSELVGQLGLPESILTELAESQGEEFSAKANEFISTLINKIVYTKVARMSFSNPFSKFEGFPVEFGDTIENIFTELPTGYAFESVNKKYVVEQIVNYFEDHYSEKISLESIAENMYLFKMNKHIIKK